MVGHKVVGCTNCGSPNADVCMRDDKFVPLFTKEELAQQLADELRNPEVLLREYRDVTVFLWVLGAFDKQKKTVDETIVEKVEQSENKVRKMAASNSPVAADSQRNTRFNDPTATRRVDPADENYNR